MPRGSVTVASCVYRAPGPSGPGVLTANWPTRLARPRMNVGSGDTKTSSVQNLVPSQTAAPSLTTVQRSLEGLLEGICADDDELPGGRRRQQERPRRRVALAHVERAVVTDATQL